ncbi:hypothetical protein NLJ89_g7975 [Agrocybe chaxingu]|uniref:Ricin B lectin domain-containing protein n=1 Tax=Agrocybe chaxingu TaxID=84603 RepID=A0A9W8MR82_9AGAR|nr:hypothetical protein NLJ89_g7975 [Agrocybe chaxingu]
MGIEAGARYVITNVKGGTAIDLDGTNNRDIIGYPKHGGPNQQWEAVQADGGWQLKNARSGTYISFEGSHHDGTKLISSSEPCKWNIVPDEKNGNAFRVFVPNTRMNFDLSNHGDSKPCTPVSLWAIGRYLNFAFVFDNV